MASGWRSVQWACSSYPSISIHFVPGCQNRMNSVSENSKSLLHRILLGGRNTKYWNHQYFSLRTRRIRCKLLNKTRGKGVEASFLKHHVTYEKLWQNQEKKEVCQVRENTVKERGIVYGFKNERIQKASVGSRLMSQSILNWTNHCFPLVTCSFKTFKSSK